MLNIPSWLLTDEQLKELVVTWRAVINDEDATPADKDELAAFDALVAYSDSRGITAIDRLNVIVRGATL